MRLLRLPLLVWRAVRWNALRGGWLADFLLRHERFDVSRAGSRGPIHVIVTVADHFEPARKDGAAAASRSVASWIDRYERLAARHADADGRPPQHTWFYRAEYRNAECLRRLSESAFRGYGEIEFHLHHGHDTHQSFARKLVEGLDWFNRRGAMLTAEAVPRRRFAYIAGNWSLDNGAGRDDFSGCNTELRALREAGCYGDFTFPALGSPAQPKKANSIYYATDDGRPKSYDTGTDVRVGGSETGDLLIFQGPLIVDWDSGRFEDGALERGHAPAPERVPAWLAANVRVAGRPDWIFVKLHTHGMQSGEVILGPPMDAVWDAMERSWNRGPFRLHFATAREAFNIVKAAEDGREGDPNVYRDYRLPPPANRRISCDAAWRLLEYGERRIRLETFGDESVTIEFRTGPLRSVAGRIRSFDMELQDGRLVRLTVDGAGEIIATTGRGAVHRGLVENLAKSLIGRTTECDS